MSKVLVLTVIEADYQWDDEELVVKASDYGQLKEKLWHSEMAAEALKAERDALRKQLDGAKELLIRIAKHVDIPALNAWMEENK